jgi:hypothetical protein
MVLKVFNIDALGSEAGFKYIEIKRKSGLFLLQIPVESAAKEVNEPEPVAHVPEVNTRRILL